jgi:hypothetical protein
VASGVIYLDVAAVRIQEWLGRTPPLKFRRGASVLLSEATEAQAWIGQLPAGVTWNDEAGEVSGVVPLKVMAASSGGEVDEVARPVARSVVRTLRRSLPYCAFHAVAASGTSYADAYPALERGRRAGALLVDAPAPTPEVVLAKPCDMCRAEAAVHDGVQVVDRDRSLCEECKQRLVAGGLTKGDRHRVSPLPERRLLSRLKEMHPSVVGFSDDFREMAIAGELSPDDAPTQLALVFADGNRVGNFLSAVSVWIDKHGTPRKQEIAKAIDEATLGALSAAVGETFLVPSGQSARHDGNDRRLRDADLTRPPVLVHLAGGDDLLVSVPAGDGWRFGMALLRAFDREMAQQATAWKLRGIPLPSLSAGVVFHHHTHPFSDVLTRAEERLKTAKQETQGETAAVAFLDLTADGDRPTPGRHSRTLLELDAAAELLGRLAAAPQSQRAALVALCRQAAESRPPGVAADDGETSARALARRVVDLGSAAIWEVVAGPDPTADRVRDRLLDSADVRAALRHALDLARWWPAAPGEGAPPGETSRRTPVAQEALTMPGVSTSRSTMRTRCRPIISRA